MQGRQRILFELGLFAVLATGVVSLFALTGLRGSGLARSAGDSGSLVAGPARRAQDPTLGAPGVAPGAVSAGTAGLDLTRPAAAVEPGPSPVGPGATALSSATATPSVEPRRVGIIAGHAPYDTGAVCPDGRREVDVTVDVAARVQALLEYRGFRVDILPEHDPDLPEPPLQNYRGAALVSIHADSCDVPGASGFKVAGWRYSSTPELDQRLVDCLYDRYAAATLLPRHDESITIDMWNYYAFREIAVDTPAAIIELGFLLDDRAALDDLRYEMALGVADGIGCFLGDPEG